MPRGVVIAATVALVASSCTWIVRVNVSASGAEANSFSSGQQISDEGRYVVYRSNASNLVGGDTNGVNDIFVRDNATGAVARVSVDSAGTQANGASNDPAISGDGRWVSFRSEATNLVAADTNGVADVFLHDTTTGATTRVSVTSTGAQATGGASSDPAVSADGRFVAFASDTTDLVAGDTNARRDIFLHDTMTGATTRVSVTSAGTEATAGFGSGNPDISDDGTRIVFTSSMSDLVAGDTNGAGDVFLHDTSTAMTTRVSVDSAGTEGGANSDYSAISGPGRYVTFASEATNLVVGDTNNFEDIFVHDTMTGTTTLDSLSHTGGLGDDEAEQEPSPISDDGRYLAFGSCATNMVADDTNGVCDVFLRDRTAGTTIRLSETSTGGQLGLASQTPDLTPDGRFVTFLTDATNAVAGDTNGVADVIVRGVFEPAPSAATPSGLARGTTTVVTVDGSGFVADTTAVVLNPPGVTVNSVTFVSEAQIDVSITVDAAAAVGPRTIRVENPAPGVGEGGFSESLGFCVSCLAIT